MRIFLIAVSVIGLCLTLMPSFLVVTGDISLIVNKNLMIIGTVLWFGTVIFWMNKKKNA